jgi:hypothetical protein
MVAPTFRNSEVQTMDAGGEEIYMYIILLDRKRMIDLRSRTYVSRMKTKESCEKRRPPKG